MTALHPRFDHVKLVENEHMTRVIDRLGTHGPDTWEEAIIAGLLVTRWCIDESEGRKAAYLGGFSGWWYSVCAEFVELREVTWLEMARIVHHTLDSWLNYALRGERHPGDPEKKADEA